MGIRKYSKTFKNIQKLSENIQKLTRNIQKYSNFLQVLAHLIDSAPLNHRGGFLVEEFRIENVEFRIGGKEKKIKG